LKKRYEEKSLEDEIKNKTGIIYGFGFDIFKDDNFKSVKCDFLTHNYLVNVLHVCFMNHIPLQLRADDIWICIMQQLSIHVNANSEKLRNKFVDYDGKEIIRVVDNSLNINATNNDWSNVINQFAKESKKLVKSQEDNQHIVDIATCTFTTSNQITQLASQVSLFSVLSSYIDYRTMTRCGIPKIILNGKYNDWKLLKSKCEYLKYYDLNWWLDSDLLNIINKIIETVEFIDNNKVAQIDLEFWSSIYRFRQRSGGATINGWINVLFPYIMDKKNEYVKNECLDWKKSDGNSPGAYPESITHAPMIWEYCGDDIECKMTAGIMGCQQYYNNENSEDENNYILAPVVGWMIHKST